MSASQVKSNLADWGQQRGDLLPTLKVRFPWGLVANNEIPPGCECWSPGSANKLPTTIRWLPRLITFHWSVFTNQVGVALIRNGESLCERSVIVSVNRRLSPPRRCSYQLGFLISIKEKPGTTVSFVRAWLLIYDGILLSLDSCSNSELHWCTSFKLTIGT